MFVPGCACRPEATIDAVVLAIGKWQQSLRALQRNMDRNRITR
jgi:Ni,Fe-hydrogenase III small subunit